jgi:PAS domain S-box-containing protein
MHTMAYTEEPPRGPKANVLLVDDRPANLLALEMILANLYCNLVRANSGKEALYRLQEGEFALILLDVCMPELDGFETAKLIRRQQRARHTPIVFVTAHTGEEFSVTEAYQLGAVDYLIKPLVPEIVRAKVVGLVDLFYEKEAARRQAHQLQLLVQGTKDYAFFLLDKYGYVATWNAGAERIKGYKAEEIIGQHFSRFYSQDLIDRGWPDHELEVAQKVGRFEDEGWRLRKDGSRFWANVILTALRDDAGRLLGFSKITRDLTERKRAEEAIRQANTELEERVRQRTNELARANEGLEAEIGSRKRLEQELLHRLDQLAAADRDKNEFLAMLAHELRNPLAPVRNALQILKMPGADSSTVEQAHGMMERQVGHLVRLVDDLLDVSRIMRGRVELRPEQVDLAAVVARAVETAQPAIDAQGHQLTVALPPVPVMVHADLVRLSQAISNLLMNAAKYTQQPSRIWLSAERDGGDVVVRVRDTGSGIAKDLLPRIFDLFVQADRSLARSQGGLGVGLTLVKQVVQMHGGSVSAFSAGPDQGSEFTLRLPILPERQTVDEDHVPEKPAQPDRPSRKVLVVDDNVDAAESAAMLLRLGGHQVRTVHDGPSVLKAVRDFRPEIILLDIGLPGMTGYEVAKQLRAQPEFESLLLAAMTGYGQDEDKRRSKEAGFDLHLTKPLDPHKLEAIIASPHAV